MKRHLEGHVVDNYLTPDNKDDKFLLIKSAGRVNFDDLIDEMQKEETGITRETLELSVKLHNRCVSNLVTSGHSVNTGLFRAAPSFRGILKKGKWDPEHNSIHVSIIPDKDLREAIADATVDNLGPKPETMYIVAGEDAVTRADDGTATAGRNYTLHGKYLKVVGDHSSVGISLTNASGQKFLLTPDMIAENTPTKLIILLPTGLDDGDYTLTVTTQFTGSGTLLKAPRSADKVITLGKSSGGIGTLPTEPPSGGGGGIYIDPNA
jgi:hypothetical protein